MPLKSSVPFHGDIWMDVDLGSLTSGNPPISWQQVGLGASATS